jgi:predicted SAM-dependent methyltransferase
MLDIIRREKPIQNLSEISPQFYPIDKSKIVKIDLASGINYYKGKHDDEIDEWIHIDHDTAPHVEIVCDFVKGIPIEDNVADEVHSSEFLEHICPWQESIIMKEFNRIMKIGCRFFGTTPSLSYVCREFNAGRMDYWYASRNLYGDGNGYPHTHYRLFTIEELAKFLNKWGFGNLDFTESPGAPNEFWIVFNCIKIKNV